MLFKDSEISVSQPCQKRGTADACWSTSQEGHLSLVTIREGLQRGHGGVPDLGNLHCFENLRKLYVYRHHYTIFFCLQ